MSPLRERLMAGEMVTTRVNGVDNSIWLQGTQFVMVKQNTGFDSEQRHSLFVDATDDARLAAHWEGYCGAETRAPLAKLPPRMPEMRVVDGIPVPVRVDREARATKIWVNQQWRDYSVLGVIGDRALIEYEMPNGRHYLLEISWDAAADRPLQIVADERPVYDYSGRTYRPVAFERTLRLAARKNISRAKIPSRWRAAAANAEVQS